MTDHDSRTRVKNILMTLPTGDSGNYFHEDLVSAFAAALRETAKDYEEVLEDKRRLTKNLDGLMNGNTAAQQASLCDIVSQFPQWKESVLREAEDKVWKAVIQELDHCHAVLTTDRCVESKEHSMAQEIMVYELSNWCRTKAQAAARGTT